MHCKHYNGQLPGNSIHGDVRGLKIYRGDAVTALQNTEKKTPHNTKVIQRQPCRKVKKQARKLQATLEGCNPKL